MYLVELDCLFLFRKILYDVRLLVQDGNNTNPFLTFYIFQGFSNNTFFDFVLIVVCVFLKDQDYLLFFCTALSLAFGIFSCFSGSIVYDILFVFRRLYTG